MIAPVEIQVSRHHAPAGLFTAFDIPGEPRSKARVARARNGHAYLDKKTAQHQDWLAHHMRMQIAAPLAGGVAIEVTFHRSNKQRIDVDNMMKAVLDAATGVLWVDDVQVVRLVGSVELDRENPRTSITFYEHSTSMPRGVEQDLTKTCRQCGEKFTTRAYQSKPNGADYCSKACVANPPAVCDECGAVFKKNSAAQRFCTKRCASQALSTRQKIAYARRKTGRPLPTCQRCGAGLKRHGAVLCRPCWLSRGPDGMKGVRKADLLRDAA